MKKLVITIFAALLLVGVANASVLTAKLTVEKHKSFSKGRHGWWTFCSGVEVKLKYNPTTDRGRIEFGESCVGNADRLQTFIRVYDADGFQINAFKSYQFEPYASFNIMATDLTEQERKAIRKIRIDFFNEDSVDWIAKYELKCPSNRELNADDFICERKCDDNHIYDSETDKCEALYDSKATAEYEPVLEEPNLDNVADKVETYASNRVNKAETFVGDSIVYVDQKSETQVVETREQMYARLRMSDMLTSNIAPEPWYSSGDGKWHCDDPYEFDGQGGFQLRRRI